MERVESINRCYLREPINIEEKACPEKYRVRMLQRNKIGGLLRVDQRNLDGCAFLYYDITGLQNMKSMQCTITVEFMDKFVGELEHLLKNLEAYLLQQKEICMLPEYIWSGHGEGKWRFAYIPGWEKGQRSDIGQLVEFIMDHLDCNDEEGLERFYGFYSDILQAEFLNIREFIGLWKKRENEHQKLPERDVKREKSPEKPEGISEKEEYGAAFERKRGEAYKERIYLVPFHGIKIGCYEHVSLT